MKSRIIGFLLFTFFIRSLFCQEYFPEIGGNYYADGMYDYILNLKNRTEEYYDDERLVVGCEGGYFTFNQDLLLTKITLYFYTNQKYDIYPFAGILPFGLKSTDSRTEIESKLGKPDKDTYGTSASNSFWYSKGVKIEWNIPGEITMSAKMKIITIEKSLSCINKYFFVDGTTLIQYTGNEQKIVIPDSVTSIAKSVFYKGTMKEVVVPANVNTIGEDAFQLCGNLITITLPEKLETISTNLFFGCRSLKVIKFPTSLKRIDHSAFFGCTSIESIIIPEGVEKIGDSVFSNCTSLKTIVFPGTLRSIDLYIFNGCKNLTEIVFSYDKSNSQGYILDFPNIYTNWGADKMFNGCDKLQKVSFPKNSKFRFSDGGKGYIISPSDSMALVWRYFISAGGTVKTVPWVLY
ncbi:MAG: leucine-rich repeat domain-containing protein [Spirochaetaceae bacterium]|jgi:hypothetical protein|nr:leucine-rich repeat domain-containing protein [Spirochaetaceae bacterium]